MILLTGAVSVFLYHANQGQFRVFLALGILAGYIVYHNTLGRLVMIISETIVRILKKIIFTVLIRPLRWVVGKLRTAVRWISGNTAGLVRKYLNQLFLEHKRRRCIRQFSEFVRLQP